MLRKLFLAIVIACISTPAAATTLVSGPTLSVDTGTVMVMVNNGSQFVIAKPGQALKAGDRVMALQGGSATLTYADGTKFTVNSCSMYSVGSVPEGKYKSAPNGGSFQKVGPMYTATVGDTSSAHPKVHLSLWADVVATALVMHQRTSPPIGTP